MKDKKAITLKTLTKSNIWELQENDVFRMWEAAEKEADLKEYVHRYIDVIKSAFDFEEIMVDRPEIIKKYEDRGFKVGSIRIDDGEKRKMALKKHAILTVKDLTRENIRHISAAKLVEVLDRNFGGGWDSLTQAQRDIIEVGFDVTTNTLPKDRLHIAGGLYEKKVADGYDVLEIAKGTWVEAIFVKEKPELFADDDEDDDDLSRLAQRSASDDDEDDEEIINDFKQDDDEDDYDEEMLTEESYRTTYETDPEDLNYEAEEISDEGDY